MLWDRNALRLGDPGGNLPVVVNLAGHMRRQSCYGDSDGEQDCELSEGKHDERKRTGGNEGE